MAKIKFSNGKTVDFNGTPTQADIEEVAKQFQAPSLAERAVSAVKSAIPIPSSPNIPASQLESMVGIAKKARDVEKVYPAENLLPMAGATAGAVGAGALSAGNTVMMSGGAMLGGAGGEALRQGISTIRGNEGPKDPLERVRMMAEQGTLGAVAELVTPFMMKTVFIPALKQIVDKTGSVPVLKTGKDLVNFVIRTANRAGKGVGIADVPTIPVATEPTATTFAKGIANRYGEALDPVESGEKIVSGYERGYGKNLSKQMARESERNSVQIGKANERMRSKIDEFGGRYGGEYDPLKGGSAVKGEWDKTYGALKEIENAKWEAFRKVVGKKKINPGDTVDVIEAIDKTLKEQGFESVTGTEGMSSGTSEALKKAYSKYPGMEKFSQDDLANMLSQMGDDSLSKTLKNAITGESGKLKAVGTIEGPESVKFLERTKKMLQNPDLDMDGLINIGRSLSKRAGLDDVRSTGMEGAYKYVGGIVSKNLERLASVHKAGALFRSAKSQSSDIFKLLDSDSAKGVYRNNPENIIDSVIQTNNPTEIGKLFKHLTEEGKNGIRRGFFDKIAKSKNMATELEKYTPETINAVFGKQSKSLYDLAKLSKDVAELPQFLSGKSGVVQSKTEQAVSDIIKSKKPSEIANSLMQSQEITEQAVKMLDKKTIDIVRRGWLDNLFEKAKVVDRGIERIDQSKLLSQLSGYSKDQIQALFREESGPVLALLDVVSHTGNMGDYSKNVLGLFTWNLTDTIGKTIERLGIGKSIEGAISKNMPYIGVGGARKMTESIVPRFRGLERAGTIGLLSASSPENPKTISDLVSEKRNKR